MLKKVDRLCCLVVRVPGYRSRGPGSIPALPDFLISSGSFTGSTQPLSTIEELLGRKNSSLYGCEMFRIARCLDSRLIDGGKVVSPTHQPHFTPQKHYYFNVSGIHFC
jgi:hypothetical protein